MAVNHDSFVKTTLVDESILTPAPEATVVGFSYLQPFFSRKGLDNVITRFTGVGAFEREYGDDIDSVKKYGHGGLIAREVVSGGGIVDACRLMPENSSKAGIVLGVAIGTHGVGSAAKKHVRVVSKAYNNTVSAETNLKPYMIDAAGEVITEVPDAGEYSELPDYYTVYPLIVASAKGRGLYGNDLGIKIELDTSREGKNKDGRRYTVRFYDSSVVLGDAYEFISTSFNASAVAVPGTKIPDSYDVVYKTYAITYRLPITSSYSSENFDSIIDELNTVVGLPEAEKYLIDVFYGVTAKNQDYSDIVFESLSTMRDIKRFTGGSDGDLFNESLVTSGPDAGKKKKDVVREELLIAFYSGDIDKNIYDCRIIDCGITLDAWFPSSVKEVMVGVFGAEVRDDVAVYLDCGEGVDNLTAARQFAIGLAGNVSAPYGNVCINIHNGTTRNRTKNLRTSGNYEIASSLPKLYRTYGPFTVHAGFFAGRVRNMTFDYYPRVVKNDLEIAPLREAKLLFAMKLERGENFCFMSDDSQYNTDFSVLGSIRNLIFAGEVIRTIKKVLVKYSFHPDNAAGAIKESTSELDQIFSGRWFPPEMPIVYSIFQTRNDKINNSASVSLAITYPDVIETWKVTITANRQPIA